MKPLMINATDRNTINHDNYQFYFNKLLTLNGIKIQNHVLTEDLVKANFLQQLSTIGGIAGWGLIIFNHIYPNAILKTAGLVAMGASNMMNRANTLVNVGYGEDMLSSWGTKTEGSSTDLGKDLQTGYTNLRSSYTDSETWAKPNLRSSFANPQGDYTVLKNSLANVARKLGTPLEKIPEQTRSVVNQAVTSIQEEDINEEMGILNRKGEGI